MRAGKFIERYRDVLRNGSEFWNVDSSLMSPGAFDGAGVRWLVVFPSDSWSKDVSMTPTVLLDWVRSVWPGGEVFVDFAFLPCRDDVRWYDKEGVPYAVGVVSHRDASEFDVVGFSVSCLYEVPAVAWCMGSFGRCVRPVPLSWSERRGRCDVPIVYAGGASVVYGDVLFGELGDGRVSFLDFMYLGAVYGERVLFDWLLGRERGSWCVDDVLRGVWASGFGDHFYQPQAYRLEWDGVRVVGDVKVVPEAPDAVRFCVARAPGGLLGAAAGYVRASGGNAGLAEVEVSGGCGGAGMCTFCAEGWLAGGFVAERGDLVRRRLVEARLRSGSEVVKLSSYNLNSLPDWKGVVCAAAGVYDRVQFANMRMDELGRDAEGLELCFAVGFRRGTAPIEGVSPRIWNGLFNKNLDEGSVEAYMRSMIEHKVLDIKVGVIVSGYEEDGDWRWLLDAVSRWRGYAEGLGCKLPLRLNVTPLVQYPLTPLWVLEKKAFAVSFLDGEWMPRWVFDGLSELGVRVKFNGYRYSTMLEQSMVSLGRLLCGALYRVVSSGAEVRSLRDLRGTVYFDEVCRLVHGDWHAFVGKCDVDALSPYWRVRGPLDAARRVAGARLLAGEAVGVRCPQRVGGAGCLNGSFLYPRKCDVTPGGTAVDAGAVKMESCRACFGGVLSPLGSAFSGAVLPPRRECGVVLRVCCERLEVCRDVNPNATLRFVVSAMLRSAGEVADGFVRVRPVHSMYGQSYVGSRWSVSGRLWFDVEFARGFDVGSVDIGAVNGLLRGVRVLGVREVSDVLVGSDYAIYTFRSGLSVETWSYLLGRYDGSYMELVGDKYKPRMVSGGAALMSPVVVGCGRGSAGGFAVPIGVNPWYYLHAVWRFERLHPSKVYRHTRLECVGLVRERSGRLCVGCGGECVCEDMGSGQELAVGVGCLTRMVVNKTFNSK